MADIADLLRYAEENAKAVQQTYEADRTAVPVSAISLANIVEQLVPAVRAALTPQRDRYAQCTGDCTTDCGACKGAGRPVPVTDESTVERVAQAIADNDDCDRASWPGVYEARAVAAIEALRGPSPADETTGAAHGGLAYLDRLETMTANPTLLRAVAEVRAEITDSTR